MKSNTPEEFFVTFSKDAQGNNVNRIVIRKIIKSTGESDFLVYPDSEYKKFDIEFEDIQIIKNDYQKYKDIQYDYDSIYEPKKQKEDERFNQNVNNKIQQFQNTKPNPGSILYLALLTHGGYSLNKNADGTFQPTYIEKNIPSNIKTFSKVTYAPFSKVNWVYVMQTEDKSHTGFLNTLTTNLSEFKNKNGKEIAQLLSEKYGTGNQTTDNDNNSRVPNQTPMTESDKWQGFTYHTKVETEEDKAKLLSSTTDSSFKIIDKNYGFSKNENWGGFKMNVYLLDASGGGLDEFKNKGVMDDTFNGFNHISVSTLGLLEMASKCGYENVVMIDFSCDYCGNLQSWDGRQFIYELREKIRSNEIGR